MEASVCVCVCVCVCVNYADMTLMLTHTHTHTHTHTDVAVNKHNLADCLVESQVASQRLNRPQIIRAASRAELCFCRLLVSSDSFSLHRELCTRSAGSGKGQ